MSEALELDTSNQFEVIPESSGDICFRPGSVHLPCTLTRGQALNLAAWLSLIADPVGVDFCKLYNEIKRT